MKHLSYIDFETPLYFCAHRKTRKIGETQSCINWNDIMFWKERFEEFKAKCDTLLDSILN